MKKNFTTPIFFLLFCAFISIKDVFAQTYPMTSIDPWTMKERRKSTYYDMTSWDSSPYKEFTYWTRTGPNWWHVDSKTGYMNFRLLFPDNFDSTASDNKKYPLIVMLHGAGESGREWKGHPNDTYGINDPEYDNNDKQLVLGGEQHLNAHNKLPTDSTHFPGFVLFPQVHYSGAWENGYSSPITANNQKVINIIEKLIDSLKVDPLRIYIHGLSNGGKGVWDLINRRPDLFAAALPMSAVGDASLMSTKLAHMPIWLFQGGNDTNPEPSAANQMISALEAAGGTPRYTLYPDLGHGVWNDAYADPDFFTWMMRQTELGIHTYFGQNKVCPGEPIDVRLGISPGHYAYEWSKNGETIVGANTSELIATEVGEYRVRIITQAAHRVNESWSAWSEPAIINLNELTAKPQITALGSTMLPGLDDKGTVTLSAPAGMASYKWSNGAATRSITVSTTGNYSVSVTEENGCPSEFSDPVVVIKNPEITLGTPANLTASTNDLKTIDLFWYDNSTGETGFEIYRGESSGGPYEFVALTGANAINFSDTSLNPGTTYYYKIRAISNSGVSGPSNEARATTFLDEAAPNRPTNLHIAYSDNERIQLVWSASTDNIGVAGYFIYRDDIAIGTVTEGLTFEDTEITENGVYKYYVKAYDANSNLSEASNQVIGKAVSCGLTYAYYKYEDTWSALPDFSGLTPVATGTSNNFDISNRDVNDRFAFKFDGKIKIFTPGEYTFYTSSDDGSKLYIDGLEVVDNDGNHGNRERSGKIHLNAGIYDITVTYYEGTGNSEILVVRYEGPGIAKQPIPDDVLCSVPFDETLEQPTAINAIGTGLQSIEVIWQDNASTETGYEIYRASKNAPDYKLITVTDADIESYTDTDVEPDTEYYYQVKAVSENAESPLSSYRKNLFLSYFPVQVNNLNEPLFSGLTPSRTGYTNNFNLTPTTKANQFAFKFEGMLRIPEDGEYVLYTTSDDGSRLYIDDNLVVDNDKSNLSESNSSPTFFTRGLHPIVVAFRQGNGGYSLDVRYSGPGIPEQRISDEMLNAGIAIATTEIDDIPPSAPTNLTERSKNDTSIGISWTASTDNVRVTGYDIFNKYGSTDSLLLSTDARGIPVSTETGGNHPEDPIEDIFAKRQSESLLAEEPLIISSLIKNLTPGTTYNIFIRAKDAAGNISGPSETLTVTTTQNNPLPVELKSFTAKYSPKEAHVQVEWITASETNNDYFTIERATDGGSFAEIGNVGGAGNSSSILEYSFVDRYNKIGLVYYRLKQTDYNGDFKYSKIVPVSISNFESFKVEFYPNPTSPNEVNVRVRGIESTGMVKIKIIDMIGNLLFETSLYPESLRYGAILDFEKHLRPGIYIAVAELDDKIEKVKLVVKN